eukprot:XP_016661704.1 PREDICTED: uncharacterized protein LOC107884358 [Acyrthosiphon pisum]
MDNIGSLRPTPCTNLNNAAYCVTHIGFYNGGLGVRRYCSSHDLGNYCNYFKPPGDEKEYETCIYTCASSGCNGPGELNFTQPSQDNVIPRKHHLAHDSDTDRKCNPERTVNS